MAGNDLYPTTYGDWAGNPKGTKPDFTRCCAEVQSHDGWRWSQCARKRGHGPDGAYCKQHDPAAVEARTQARRAAYAKELNARRYERYGRIFFTALEAIANGHNDARRLAQEVVAEFKKGER